jgi:hypothetical protein
LHLVVAIGLCGQMQKCQSQIFELDLVRFAPGKFQLVNADTRENIDRSNWPLGLIYDVKTSRKKLAHRMWTVFGAGYAYWPSLAVAPRTQFLAFLPSHGLMHFKSFVEVYSRERLLIEVSLCFGF